MSKKKAFALRINEDMLKAIEKWAADEFRSTNGQIEWMLMQYLKEHNRYPKQKDSPKMKSDPYGHFFWCYIFVFCDFKITLWKINLVY